MRRLPSLAALGVALALAFGAWGFAPGPAAAWSAGACPSSAGVTVVVDFTMLGGGVEVRCASALPPTGLDALGEAGFAVTPLTTQPAFVCRIDGLPGPADEPCSTTPPATAYWSYWTAPRGGTWRYSPVGAASSRPVAGTVEGWSFVTGSSPAPPSVPPPPMTSATPVPAPRPTPAPTAIPAARASATPTALTTARPTATPETAVPTPEASPVSVPSPSDSESARPVESTSPVPREPAAAAPPAPARGEPPGAGPLGTLLGIAAVAAVGGAAVVVRRRSAAPGG